MSTKVSLGFLFLVILFARGVCAGEYVVKPGDTLSKIARDQLGDGARWREIAEINNIDAPYTIRADQRIVLPERGRADSETSGEIPAGLRRRIQGVLEWLGIPGILAIMGLGIMGMATFEWKFGVIPLKQHWIYRESQPTKFRVFLWIHFLAAAVFLIAAIAAKVLGPLS